MEQWYSVRNADVIRVAGAGVLTPYGGYLVNMLTEVFDTYPWKPWRFPQLPPGFWNDISVHKRFFDWLGEKLGVVSYEDWYKVSAVEVQEAGGLKLLRDHYNDSIIQAITTIYPQHPWLQWRFAVEMPGTKFRSNFS